MDTQTRILESKDVLAYKALRQQAFRESSMSFSESLEDEIDQSIEFFQACMGLEPEHFSVGSFDLATNQLHLWVLNPESSGAKRLYLRSGFLSQGTVVKNDLKIDGLYVDAEYMILSLI